MTKFNRFFSHTAWSHPLSVALLSAVIAGGVSLTVSNMTGSATQDRQVRLEGALEFALSSAHLVALGSDFISAVTANEVGGLPAAKSSLRRELGMQIATAQSVSDLFGPSVRAAADAYMGTLESFSLSLDRIDTVADIGIWVQGFDQAIIAHEHLRVAMLDEIGTRRSPT